MVLNLNQKSKDRWGKLSTLQKRWAILIGLIGLLGVSSTGVAKGYRWVSEKIHATSIAEVDSLKNETTLLWEVIQDQQNEIDLIEIELERQRVNDFFDWHYKRATSRDLDDFDYYVVFDDGNPIEVDLRRTNDGVYAFLFNYSCYPAQWSSVDNKYVIIPPEYGNTEYRIFKR